MQTKLFLAALIILSFLASGASMAADSANITDAEAKAKSHFDHINPSLTCVFILLESMDCKLFLHKKNHTTAID